LKNNLKDAEKQQKNCEIHCGLKWKYFKEWEWKLMHKNHSINFRQQCCLL